MLVLTRKVGESVLIGSDVEIKITGITGDKVRIGIEAPALLKILRKELFETIEENQEAAKSIKADQLKDFLKEF